MAKNPFMRAYLSAANRVANTARGQDDKRDQAPDHQHCQRLGRCMDPQAQGQGEAGAQAQELGDRWDFN